MGTDFRRRRLGVLMGGLSKEGEVSLSSGEKVYGALKSLDYDVVRVEISSPDELISQLAPVDLAFICLHGGIGEDGTVQALLDILKKPYTGSPPLACRLAMDKLLAKEAFAKAGIPTPPYVDPDDSHWPEEVTEAAERLGYPLVVKPRAEGSSLGVRIIRSPAELKPALQKTKEEFGRVFIEEFIPGKEITAGILRLNGEDSTLPLVELRPRLEFYNYQAKYTPGSTEFVIPAELASHTAQKVQKLALAAHHTLGCFGFSRVDLRVTEEGEPFVLEVNAIPGMTATSNLSQAAGAIGIEFGDLIEYMLNTAIKEDEHA